MTDAEAGESAMLQVLEASELRGTYSLVCYHILYTRIAEIT